MKILDENKLTTGLGSEYTSDTVAIVFKTSEDMGDISLGLIIPKFMVGYNFKNGDKPSETNVSISGKKILNDSSVNFGSSSVKIKNYIKAYPLLNQNISMPKYVVGDKVFVSFIDQDIKTVVFYPYSINRLGQRATDEIMIAVPASPETNTEITTDNAYYFNMDSKKTQSITLATSKENKEICRFIVTLDGKNGALTITDEERTITIDNPSDTISLSNAGGSSITLSEDQIFIKANTINIEAETDLNITTDEYSITSSTYNSVSDSVNIEHENETVTVTKGEYNIRQEKHSGTSVAFTGSTFHVDIPVIGLNGQVVFPNFVIGNIPNINTPVPAINGASGPSGSMVFNTGVGGLPLCTFPSVSSILTSMAVALDAKLPSTPGVTTALVSGLLPTVPTKKITST